MLTVQDVSEHKRQLDKSKLLSSEFDACIKRFIHTFCEPNSRQKQILLTQFDCRGGDR